MRPRSIVRARARVFSQSRSLSQWVALSVLWPGTSPMDSHDPEPGEDTKVAKGLLPFRFYVPQNGSLSKSSASLLVISLPRNAPGNPSERYFRPINEQVAGMVSARSRKYETLGDSSKGSTYLERTTLRQQCILRRNYIKIRDNVM